MSYFFTHESAFREFNELSMALASAGRIPGLLPFVERGVYHVEGKAAAPSIKIGADVLPWWPTRGVYLVVERGNRPPLELVEVSGVAGVWWGTAISESQDATRDSRPISTAPAGLQLSYLFLDADPVAVAQSIRASLEQRWADKTILPLLASPFHTVAGYDCDRHLP
jgi:hypothetical protein